MSDFDVVQYAKGKIEELKLYLHGVHSYPTGSAFVVSLQTNRQNSAVLTTGGTKDLPVDDQKKVVDVRLSKLSAMLNGEV